MIEARPLIFTSLETHGLEPGCDGVFTPPWGADLTVDRTTLTVVIPHNVMSDRVTKSDVFDCAIWVGVRLQERSSHIIDAQGTATGSPPQEDDPYCMQLNN